MITSRSLIIGLLLSSVGIALSSCSQEGPNKPNANTSGPEQTQGNSLSLLELSKPNPAAMDTEVAALVETAWNTLNTALASPELTDKSRAEAYANYGLTAFGNGLALPAELAFENATRLAPTDTRWIYFLALMHQYNGKLDQAATSFQQVLKLEPENSPALLRLGNVRFEQAEMQLASRRFNQALAINPNSAAALYGLGQVANADAQYSKAVRYFEQALELQPQADRINYFLGTAWRNLGERDKAKDYLSKHGSNEPGFPDPLFDQVSGGEARIDGLWAHMNAGSQAFVDGNYAVAVDEFLLATKDLPDDPRSWQSLGMALNKTRDVEASIAAYRRALELSEDNASIHHELAKLLMSARNNQEAEAHLDSAIKIDPRMLAAHTTLARLLAKTGRLQDALARYKHALSLDPQSGPLAISIAETLIALDRTAEAEQALRQATEINPSDANVRMSYALVVADLGQAEQAMQEAQRALADADNDETRSRAHYAIGQVLLKQGQAAEAITSFGSALKLNPRHLLAGLELARTFIRVRDLQQALGTYQVFLKNWPDHDGARVEAARVAVMRGDGAQAKKLLEAGATREAASARLLGSLARLLILSTEPEIRDPRSALQLARKALTLDSGQPHQETLALCQAALGNFEQAVALQNRLLKGADKNTIARVRTRMERNLERYRAKNLGRLPFDAS